MRNISNSSSEIIDNCFHHDDPSVSFISPCVKSIIKEFPGLSAMIAICCVFAISVRSCRNQFSNDNNPPNTSVTAVNVVGSSIQNQEHLNIDSEIFSI